jgi:hypothetical protein
MGSAATWGCEPLRVIRKGWSNKLSAVFENMKCQIHRGAFSMKARFFGGSL